MIRSRKRVLLTGATGNWGRAALAEFARRADRFEVTAFVLPGDRRRGALPKCVRVVEGDLTDLPSVEAAVRGADYVVHLGAVVSPLADDLPELTHRVNVGGTRNLVRAILAQPDPGAIGLVAAGSVAETGDRNPPVHWGRVGDPLRVSRYDEYGQSKIAAEREVVDSGLDRWVWLRQTGIFHPGLLKVRDPIITHTPLAGVMEWASAEDSARLVAGICEADAPPQLWGGVYNIGGGAGWRLTNWEFLVRLMGALGVTDVRRWYERRWFATRNFHGHWFTDSDRLDELVPFRRDTFDDALARAVPRAARLAGRVPPWLVKKLVLDPLTRHPRGTMAWLRDSDTERLDAYFGPDAVGDWSDFSAPDPSRTPVFLDHGYDEDLDPAQWTVREPAKAAAFRGGELLSRDMVTGDVRTPLRWRCAFGHTFPGSPRLVLLAGHWCPECVRNPADYPRQAGRNPFLAQVVR